MYLGNHTGTKPTILTTEKPFSGYGFVLKGHLPLIRRNDQPEVIEADLKSFLQTIEKKVSITTTYVLKDGTPIRKIPQLPLMTIAEFAQFEEGLIKAQFEETEIDNQTAVNYIVSVYLPLTKNGNILFNNDEVMTLELNTPDGDVEIDVYTIESALASPDYFKYSTLDVLSGKKEVVFPIGKYETVMIPLPALTVGTEISLTYTNGKVVRYKRPELEFIGLLVNDVVLASNVGQINGYGNYAILDVSSVKEIQINRSTTSPFSMISVEREVVNNVNNVQSANRGLVDLTEIKLNSEIMDRLN